MRTNDDEHVVVRLRAELAASAWRVLEIGPDPNFATAPLFELAAHYSARAALRAHESMRKIELFVAGPAGAVETLNAPGTRPDDGVLALRATETLRARGLQIDRPPVASSAAPAPATELAPEPFSATTPPAPAKPPPASSSAREETPAPAAARALAEPAREPESTADESDRAYSPPWSPGTHARGLWLELAPALLSSPGGFPTAPTGFVAARLQPLRHVSFALFGYAPFAPAEFSAHEGNAQVSELGLGVAGYFHERFGRFELELGGGLLGSRFAMSGHAAASSSASASPSLLSANPVLLSAGPFASSNLHFNLGGGVRVCLAASIGALFERVVVRFDSSDVAHFGRPFALASLGLELPVLALGD